MPSLVLIEITRDRIHTETSRMCGPRWCDQWRMEIPRFVAMVSVRFLAVVLLLTYEVPIVFAKSFDALEGMNPLCALSLDKVYQVPRDYEAASQLLSSQSFLVFSSCVLFCEAKTRPLSV